MGKLNSYPKQSVLDSTSLALVIVPSEDGTTFATKLLPVNLINGTEATYDQAVGGTESGVYMSPERTMNLLQSIGINAETGIPAVDLNQIKKSGTYQVTTSSLNGPSGVTGYLFHLVQGGGWNTQIIFSVDSVVYVRAANGDDSTWYDWKAVYMPYKVGYNQGDVAAGSSHTFYLSSADYWSINILGDTTLTLDEWPVANRYRINRIGLNFTASGTITWTNTINWVKPDGSTSTSFADVGQALPATGMVHFEFWSIDAGTTIYGRLLK